MIDLNTAQLEQALAIRQQIDALESQLRTMFSGEGQKAARRIRATKPAKPRGGLTPEGRRKLSENMKARWAARRGKK